MRAKINIFLIIGVGLFLFSCEENMSEQHPVPSIRVNFSVNILNTPELQIPLNAKYIGSMTGRRLGYKGHGIYVMRINDKEFRAFDASCTYISATEQHAEIATHLLLKENQKIVVYCSKCQTQFNLADGSVQSGIARFPMREYKTLFTGNTLRVFN